MVFFVILLALVICFVGVLLFGAPYLPTLSAQAETALKLADLKSGQTLLDLGCGDGKILVVAAQRGIKAIGYELNPILFIVAWVRTRRFHGQVRVVWGNFWQKAWPQTDAIFVFLLDRYMDKLDKKCVQYPYKPLKLISFAFKIRHRKPVKFSHGVYLYQY